MIAVPERVYRRRRITDRVMSGLTLLATAAVLLPLFFILWYLGRAGLGAITPEFFTHLPRPVGEPGGGMANAIAGSLILVGLAAAVGVPAGVFGGIFLAEFHGGRLAAAVRFFADVLNGTPSIVIGLFAYAVVVVPLRSFSGFAGAAALGIIMIPTVLRTTEELVRLVPATIREAGLALGVPQWKVTVRIVLPTAWAGVLTGIMVAVARVFGETAPLLFTAFGNRFWNVDPTRPVAALPLQIFAYAISPYDDWHRQAWAGALVLVSLVLVANVVARAASRSRAAR